MCAMTADERVASNGGVFEESSLEPRRPRRDGAGRAYVFLLCLAAIALGGGAAYYKLLYQPDDDSGRRLLTTAVKRGNLVITVTEDGNVESARNLELKCEVPGPITILDIIQDGTHVEKGDKLVQLDSSTIEDQVNAQQIVVSTAEAKKITEERAFAAAAIAVNEYAEGTFIQQMEQCDADITVAKQNLSTAENQLQYTRKMLRKAYANQLELESKEYLVEQAKLNLKVAQTAKTVLEKYTKAKTMEELESTRDSAEAMMKSAQAEYDLQKAKLERLQRQMSKCMIVAPQSGMVVYANDTGGSRWGQQGPKIDLGASVNEFQAILRLPDLANMQVKALVHESKVDSLRPGMRAVVKIQDRELQGTVASIANQAEPNSFFSGNVKEYATIIKIDGHPDGLKPGMTAEVEVLVQELRDVLQVPVQCVVEKAGKFYAWVKTPRKVERREVVLGGTNDTEIEIKDGLAEGDLVLQNPRAEMPDAREEDLGAGDEGVDVKKRFGDAAPGEGDVSPEGQRGGRGGRGGPGMAGGPGGPGGGPGGPGGGPGGPGGGPGGPGGGGRRGGGGGGRGRMNFADLDKDKDGKLTADEMPEPMRANFGTMDANGDGFVDRSEHTKAVEEFRKRMQQQGGGGRGGPGGPGGGPGGPGGGPGGPGGRGPGGPPTAGGGAG